mgnify:CR=1 FL=1
MVKNKLIFFLRLNFSLLFISFSKNRNFLFDTKGKLPGGNNIKFDWKLLKRYTFSKPFILSGGIGLEDISDIKKIIKTGLPIHAIDVNSKFEISPGNKNIELLKEFKLKLF